MEMDKKTGKLGLFFAGNRLSNWSALFGG